MEAQVMNVLNGLFTFTPNPPDDLVEIPQFGVSFMKRLS